MQPKMSGAPAERRVVRATTSSWRRLAAPQLVMSRDVETEDVRRRRSSGELLRVRRGAYREASTVDPSPAKDAELVARARLAAVAAQLRSDFWFSHSSAALLWGCPVWPVPTTAHVSHSTRPNVRGARDLVRHHVTLPEGDRATVHGLPVTTLERTVVDSMRVLAPGAALVVADSAIRLGVDTVDVTARLAASVGARGVRRARLVWTWADGAAESAGESLTRAAVLMGGLPSPELQVPVATRLGRFWLDMAYVAERVAIEFDGMIKYSGVFGDPAEVIAAERRRQAALEALGWIIVRVTWPDLADPARLAARIAAARRVRR
jgi:very-short-patch-repair endonuclease